MNTISAAESKLLVKELLDNYDQDKSGLIENEIIVNEDNGHYPVAFKVWIDKDQSHNDTCHENYVSFWTLSVVFDQCIAREMFLNHMNIDYDELKDLYTKETSKKAAVFVADNTEIKEQTYCRPTNECISHFMKEDFKEFFRKDWLMSGLESISSSYAEGYKMSESQLVASRMGCNIDTIIAVKDIVEQNAVKEKKSNKTIKNAAIISGVSFLVGIGVSIFFPLWALSKLIKKTKDSQ